MNIFDEFERTDSGPGRRREDLFNFLNRANGVVWEEVRQLIERWFARYPSAKQGALRSALAAGNERQMIAALWELYLHEVFLRQSFHIEVEPGLPSGLTPDFRIGAPGLRFYLEATTLQGLTQHEVDHRRMAAILDAVDGLLSPNFFLDFDVPRIGKKTPSLKKILLNLGAWLEGLNPDDYTDQAFSYFLPRKEFYYDDWTFSVRPILKHKLRGVPGVRTLAGDPGRGFRVNDDFAMRDRLMAKARKYKSDLDEPYVIGLLSTRLTTAEHMVRRALFGGAHEHPDALKAARLPSWMHEEPEPLWLTKGGPRRTHVSATLAAMNVWPWTAAQRELTLYLNPWATSSLNIALPFRTVRLDGASGELVVTPAIIPPWGLLGIPKDWPPDPWANQE